VHYLVPGGALSGDGQTWLPARGGFFLPVRPLGILFRAKFRDGLRKTSWFEQVPARVWSQAWVVHCQPVGNGLPALRYLARYVFRVALSNQRIQRVVDAVSHPVRAASPGPPGRDGRRAAGTRGTNGDQVTFSYQDGESGETRLCTLAAEEFIRRFLQHILPKGWVKVRYYGFFSPGQRQRLAQLRQRLGGLRAPDSVPPTESLETRDPAAADGPMPAQLPARCPTCGEALQWMHQLRPGGRDPPRS